MSDPFKDVGEFHRRFDLPHLGDGEPPRLLLPEDMEFRIRFLAEEHEEIVKAYFKNDLAGVADGLVDLVYVALGTAHLMGLPFDQLWAEVHRANLTKERATSADDPRGRRGHRLDVVKPEGWEPPDLERVLRDYLYVYHDKVAE